MSKNKSAKYKITDTDIDKKFIGKQVTVEKVKSNGGPGSGGERKPGSTNKITLAKLSDKVDTLANNLDAVTNNLNAVTNNLNAVTNNLDKLAKIVTDGFAEQAKINKSIREDLNRVIKLNNLKH